MMQPRIPLIAAVTGVALLLVALGALGMYFALRGSPEPVTDPHAGMAMPPAAPEIGATPVSDVPLPDVTVTMSKEMVDRAGLVMATATTSAKSSFLRLPGLVEPNAYRRVEVTPLVSGRITAVHVELGAVVRRGQPLAQLFSPELAEAQKRFASARAQLAAQDREAARTERLAAIGAASQQELERVRADQMSMRREVEGARATLQVLGMSAAAVQSLAQGGTVAATVSVPAPIAGIVTDRSANLGLNVDPSMKLFTVADLSTVWVIANVQEKDFARVRVGSHAAVSAAAYPGLVLRGRVAYIDPEVNPETRTAQARIEVGNPQGRLRLGMYVDVDIETPGSTGTIIVPRTAIQAVGNRAVVYLAVANAPGQFIEREVRLGETIDDSVEVLSGLNAGDRVVAQGSFFVRAERERLGLRQAAPSTMTPPRASTTARPQSALQQQRIIITEKGFEPARVTMRQGPARLTFVRTTDATCATEVVVPSLNIKRALPLSTPVNVDVQLPRSGDVSFACGMDMLKGRVVIQ
jgi:membrane fusion protein, heavy metal efflux system